MFLKNLQIKGFKSFADPATLVLEPGVTVVVGPNGSGKSNVVDAIGWVLGAQAPSAVRSAKMDDVIFAGTSTRPALGRAEVSLTIDNSSGQLPINFTEVTVTRLLFRSGDSEYSLNGVPCRLLDIQELLSDSGVGRQQHVIISQGNIDGVLNARPEERRSIIEEAAGVLKFRRRKERAERRLTSTEANLTRIQDLLREVRRQLRPLERQADAARRHGDLVGELRALRVHLAGRELARLRQQLADSADEQGSRRTSSAALRATLADLDARIIATEAELSGLGASDVGDSLVRLETLRERGRGQLALLAERGRGIQRELEATVDAAVVASLDAEQAQLRSDSTRIAQELASLEVESSDLAASEERLTSDWADFEGEWAGAVPVPTGEASAMRSELAALLDARERSRSDQVQLERRRAAMQSRLDRLTSERDSAGTTLAAATKNLPALRAAVESANAELRDARSALAAADDGARQADATASAWTARVDALSMALDDARQRAGAERLAGLEGVLGTLMELVEVDPGWEEAFEAAAGEALGAVVVSDVDAARRALAALVGGDHNGAVLALGSRDVAMAPVSGLEPVRSHVRSAQGGPQRAGVDALLDSLLASAVAVEGDWSDAAGLSAARPELLVITRSGHRFGASGWRLGAAGSGATGAALDEARRIAESSELERNEAHDLARVARAALDEADGSAQLAGRALERGESDAQRSGDAIARLEVDAAEVAHEVESLSALIEQIVARHAVEVARIESLEADLPELEAADAELSDRAAAMLAAREDLDARTASLRSRRTGCEVRGAALEERRRHVADRLEHVEERLSGLLGAAEAAGERRTLLEARAVATELLSRFVGVRLEVIEEDLEHRRGERRRQSEAARAVSERLEGLRRRRSGAESSLDEARTRLQQAEIADAEARTRLHSATEALRSELDCEPEEAMASGCPPLPEGVGPGARARELERELRAMGPINPLALQEFEELSERHTFLESQLDDVRRSRRELSKVIRAVDDEIVKVFASAFADVSDNFSTLFETLFPGGTGRLRLTEPDNLLSTGIEIEAKPSGKNVRKLSLLSGGERSLTAVAYLFAVFRSRPSPFYVMDEVEAALDDVNLHRFLELINEFRSTAQLIVVSHQKRTMEAADLLYGVSMEPGGSSKVVSERSADVVDIR